jgi:hypothetical protein
VTQREVKGKGFLLLLLLLLLLYIRPPAVVYLSLIGLLYLPYAVEGLTYTARCPYVYNDARNLYQGKGELWTRNDR